MTLTPSAVYSRLEKKAPRLNLMPRLRKARSSSLEEMVALPVDVAVHTFGVVVHVWVSALIALLLMIQL